MSDAIALTEYGGPEVLHLIDLPPAAPGPGQVRIRVRAASVNPFDLKVRQGAMGGTASADAPVVLGLDAAGVVEQVGDGVELQVGDEVFGIAESGAYRQQALLSRAIAKPRDLSFELAASVVTVGRTAERVLAELGVHAGQTLLVHGAAGSVGVLAAQLAVSRGIAVVGTAGERDLEWLSTLGVRPARYGPGWMERVRQAAPQIDLIFDASGAGVLADSVELVGDPAKVVTIADPAAAEHGVRFSSGGPDPSGQTLPTLAQLAADGVLTLPIGATYPLAEAATAHADIEARRSRGKVVLLP
ncbi:MAG: NADP-dependent oxidoreductase [Actinomycetales bacterium]